MAFRVQTVFNASSTRSYFSSFMALHLNNVTLVTRLMYVVFAPSLNEEWLTIWKIFTIFSIPENIRERWGIKRDFTQFVERFCSYTNI